MITGTKTEQNGTTQFLIQCDDNIIVILINSEETAASSNLHYTYEELEKSFGDQLIGRSCCNSAYASLMGFLCNLINNDVDILNEPFLDSIESTIKSINNNYGDQ